MRKRTSSFVWAAIGAAMVGSAVATASAAAASAGHVRPANSAATAADLESGAGRAATATATLPSYYPDRFQGSGVIREISAHRLQIDGLSFALANELRVYDPTTTLASRFSLAEGTEVGFSFDARSVPYVIREIWILPKGSVTPE